MKQVKDLKVDPELRDLLPPLTDDEYKKLEENIVKDGCQSPLFIWNDYIADGHNRYSICKNHNIPFDTISLAYKDKSEVMRWMIDGQLGRRNLTPIQRVAVAEKYRHVFEDKAKENQLSGLKQNQTVTADLPKPITNVDTRKELSQLAGVGERTYDKAKKILDSDNETVKKEVLSGNKSIDAGYNEIKDKVEKVKELNINGNKTCKQCGEDKLIIDFYGDDKICKECQRSNSEDEVSKQGGGAFIDTATGRAIKSDTVGLDADILNEIKTEKNAYDYIIPKNEIDWLLEYCCDFNEQVENKFFTLLKAVEKFSSKDIDKTVDVLDNMILNIKELITKFNKKKEENK